MRTAKIKLRHPSLSSTFGSMQLQIPLGIIIIISVITLIFGKIAIQEQRERMLAQTNMYGQEAIDFIAQISIVPIQKYSFYQLENFIKQLESSEIVVFCAIYNNEGNLLAGNQNQQTSGTEHTDIAIFSAPITGDGNHLGSVEMGLDLTPVTERINSTSMLITFGLAIELLLIGLALSFFLQYKLVSPILRLSRTTHDIANGIFSESDQEKRKDEVGTLAGSINEMSRNLRESYQTLEKKVAERTEEFSAAKTRAEAMAKNLQILSIEQQTLLDNSPVGIVFVNTDRIIQRVNLEISRITGYEPTELIGQTSNILFKNKDEYETFKAHTLKAINRTGICLVTIEFQRKDGTPITCSLRGRPTRIDGYTSGIIWSIEDITAKLKMEEDLLKIKKLESIGVLAGGIAHDFNNILMAVIGNISLAEQFIDDNPKGLELLAAARKASLRAKDLTGKLLTFAKGGDPVRTTEFLPELIQESAAFILSGSNVHCSYDFEDNLWAVHMDKGQINQVIQNLVLNSSQAMQGGGSLKIICRNRSVEDNEISGLRSGLYVQLNITDTGPGIASHHLDKIFDPYFSTKEKDSNKGSGLGLAIVHSIIQKHNGTITVQSQPQEGTVFEIFLPATKEAPTKQIQEKPLLPTGKGVILVMDDDETIHTTLEEMLSYLGYTTLHAYNGNEAIDLYKKDCENEQEISAIIVDLTIPGGMGGDVAVKHLHRINPAAKVIVSSGYSNAPVLQNFREAGFANIISKPYQLLDLSRVIAETLEKSKIGIQANP